jgi:hypothetical protein
VRVDVVRIPDIVIGDALLPSQDALVFDDLDRINDGFGIRIDGVLGAPLFQGAVLTVDYVAGVLTIQPQTDTTALAGVTYVPISLRQNVPYVDIDICGIGKDTYMIDTGSGGELDVPLDCKLGARVDNLRDLPRFAVLVYRGVSYPGGSGRSIADLQGCEQWGPRLPVLSRVA